MLASKIDILKISLILTLAFILIMDALFMYILTLMPITENIIAYNTCVLV